MISVPCDYTVKSIFTMICTHLGQCNISRALMLHSAFSCLAAAHWSIIICYYMELCKLSTRQAYRSGWRMQGPFTYPKSQDQAAAVLSQVFLSLLDLPTPAVPRHHVQKLKASIRSTAKQTHTQISLCQEADNVFFYLFHGFQIQLALFL